MSRVWLLTLTGVAILSYLMLRSFQVLRAVSSQISYTSKRFSQTPMMATAPYDVLTTTATELETLLDSGKLTSAQLAEVYLAEPTRTTGI